MAAPLIPSVGTARHAGPLRLHRVRAPLHRPFRTALRTVTHLDTLLVGIVDPDGVIGWSEAPEVAAVTGHGLQRVAEVLLGPVATGLTAATLRDLEAATHQVRRVAASVPPAQNAALSALLDLDARRSRLPAHRLLGARGDLLSTTVTIARDHPAAMAAEAAERREQGCRVLKLKLGSDTWTDLARLDAVAAAAAGARLLIDANQGWNRDTAAVCLDEILRRDLAVDAVEQPLPAADLDGHAWLRRRLSGTGIELILDESVFCLDDARRVIGAGAADRINVKLAKAGGPGPAREILRFAADHGVGTMVGCMLESPLGVAPAAALALAEGVERCDLDAPLLLADSPVIGGPRIEGDRLTVGPEPGYGCVPRSPGGTAHPAWETSRRPTDQGY